MKNGRIIAGISLFAIVGIMVVLGIFWSSYNQNTKFSGEVFINGNNVRGYTVEKANQIVSQKMNDELEEININIMYQDKVWHFDKTD